MQIDLHGKWETVPTQAVGKPPASVVLGNFEMPTPASYRVDVVLEDGQTAELWGYFQVKERKT